MNATPRIGLIAGALRQRRWKIQESFLPETQEGAQSLSGGVRFLCLRVPAGDASG
ncbi:MAG: hypothetical protein LBP86_12100 [Azoarcus sp.]|jgi:hypothetical protein|nr:hypothetical protein [Azoarcus sp.]